MHSSLQAEWHHSHIATPIFELCVKDLARGSGRRWLQKNDIAYLYPVYIYIWIYVCVCMCIGAEFFNIWTKIGLKNPSHMSVYIILCFHAPVVANAFSSHRSSKSLSHNRCSRALHRISNGALQMYCHTKHVEIPHVSKIPKVHANASGIRAWHPLKWKCKGFCFEAAHDKDEYILQTNISGF